MELHEIKQKFIELYGGDETDLRVFYSPGRVNLIGEHTDYSGGFVFPAALTLGTTIVARKRDDNKIRLAATDLDVLVEAEIDDLNAYKSLWWGNYQLGVAQMLKEDGYSIVGCDLLYDDTVPHGSGLSSSAAIEVATAVMLLTFSNEKNGVDAPLDMKYAAIISQRAENQFVGVNCGIMDQFASAMGKKDCAIFLNCQKLEYEWVPFKLDGYSIIIGNTKVKHSLGSSAYNERRKSCEDGFAILKNSIPEATCLGDITKDQLAAHINEIQDQEVKMRVTHVVNEDDRVLRSIDALKNNDIETFGKLMIGSHESLRDIYEVSCEELDVMVEEALKIDGCIGSRMTGAGFGGSTVSIVRDDQIDTFIQTVGKHYTARTGKVGEFYVSSIGDGGHEIKA